MNIENGDGVIEWLLEDNDPVVQYRTLTDILNQSAPHVKLSANKWTLKKLPENWYDADGLWYKYYVTSLGECGMTTQDIEYRHLKKAFEALNDFKCACSDFMLLRAMIRLGFYDEPSIHKAIESLNARILADGGFLCPEKLNKSSYAPKSCYKANLHALMLIAECHKNGFELDCRDSITDYFLNGNILSKSSGKASVILECAVETLSPFEAMRVGIYNILESFSALGYGNDKRLNDVWTTLYKFKANSGKILLSATLSKSYIPREMVGKPSKWVTFYTRLAEKERRPPIITRPHDDIMSVEFKHTEV